MVPRRDRRGAAALTAEQFAELAERAEALSEHSESAGEVLRFAAGLYREQGAAAALLEEAPLSGSLERDGERVAESAIPLLGWIAGNAPGPLAAEAAARAAQDPLGPLDSFNFNYNKLFGTQIATTWNVYDLLRVAPQPVSEPVTDHEEET